MEKDNFGKNELEKYLNRLKDLDRQIEEDPDNDEILIELNSLINGLSRDMQTDLTKAVLKFVNKSDNPDPKFAHEGDSGFDLRAHLDSDFNLTLQPRGFVSVPTGLYFEVDKGLEIQVRPRSGLSLNNGIIILNTPGTVDSRYRGEVKIILGNFSDEPFIIKNGDRIAQGVVCPVYGEGKLNFAKVEKLSESVRNDSGFGSTGVS